MAVIRVEHSDVDNTESSLVALQTRLSPSDQINIKLLQQNRCWNQIIAFV